MPLLSVLTPALPDRAELLADAGESLSSQELPTGWEFEWIVQEDSSTQALAEVTERFPFAKHASNGEPLGIAVTRNLALTRASGDLVHVLDSDDLLLPNALGTAVEAFGTYPQIHWAVGRADDLFPGPTRLPYPALLPTGLIEPGIVTQFVLDHGHTPITTTGLTLRTNTVRALGGWVASPRAEDLALIAAVADLTPGYLTPEVTWLYRRHEDQITRQSAWVALHAESLTLIRQRISALRALGLHIKL